MENCAIKIYFVEIIEPIVWWQLLSLCAAQQRLFHSLSTCGVTGGRLIESDFNYAFHVVVLYMNQFLIPID